MTRPRNRARGFTVIELVAGLAVVGLLFLGCWALLGQLSDSNRRFLAEARRADATGNGMMVLRSLVRDAEVGTDTADRFVGNDRTAQFNTWCAVAGGWLEHCRATFTLVPFGDSTLLIATMSNVGTYNLWRGSGDAHFLYFTPSVPDDTWVSEWGASIAAPGAIGIATDQYLVVLGAGGRG